MRFFVGGYTGHVYSAELDTTNGAMTITGSAKVAENASFLRYAPQLSTLYGTAETGNTGGESGSILAWRVHEDGTLSAIGSCSSCGSAPCHIAVNTEHRLLTAANYGGGNFLAIELARDGSFGRQTSCVQHSGSSVNPDRQEGPHVHGTTISPDRQNVFVCDLGIDRIMCYGVPQLRAGTDIAGSVAASLRPGAGPRHLTFSHDGKFAYVVTELANTVVAYAYDASRAELTPLQEISVLPENYDGENTAAELQIHPSDGFLYVSNRGHDSIAVFRRDRSTGILEAGGHVSSGGSGPRHFQIEGGGRWCLVANQFSDITSSFRIDGQTGMAHATGYTLTSTAPSCVEFCEA